MDLDTPAGLPPVTWEGVSTGLVVLLAGLLLAWVVQRGSRVFMAWRGRSESAREVFGRLFGWLVVVLAVLAALTVTFPSIKPVNVLGGVGVISIAAGIAFQTVLGNMFAGIVILSRDRFNVGDQIAIREIRGTVTEINLNGTTVRTFDGRLVLVPNSVIHSEIVTVQTGFEAVRTVVPVDLDELVDLARAREVAVAAMSSLPGVLDSPAPDALLSEIGTGTVRMELRFWSGARQLETRETQDAVIRAVVAALREHDVETGSDTMVVRLVTPEEAD